MRKIIIISLLLGILTACSEEQESPYIDQVKSRFVDRERTITLETVLSGRQICSTTKWDVYMDDLNRNIVEYQCDVPNIEKQYASQRDQYVAEQENRYEKWIDDGLAHLAEVEGYEAKEIAENEASLKNYQELLNALQKGERFEDIENFYYKEVVRNVENLKKIQIMFQTLKADPTAARFYDFLTSEVLGNVRTSDGYNLIMVSRYSDNNSFFIAQYGHSLNIPNYDPENYEIYLRRLVKDLPHWEKYITKALVAEEQEAQLLKERIITGAIQNIDREIQSLQSTLENAHRDSDYIKDNIEQSKALLRNVKVEAAERYPHYQTMRENLRWIVNDYGDIFFQTGVIIATEKGREDVLLQYGESTYVQYIFSNRDTSDINTYLNNYERYAVGSWIVNELLR